VPQLTGESVWELPTEAAEAEEEEEEPAAPQPEPEPAAPAAPAPAPEPEPEPAAEEPLPDGWEARVSSSTGETYFFNTVTQESEWDRPTTAATAAPVAAAPAAVLKVLAPAPVAPETPVPRATPASVYSATAEDEEAEHEVPPVPPAPTLSRSDIAPEALEAWVPPHEPPPVPTVKRAQAELRAVVALMPTSGFASSQASDVSVSVTTHTTKRKKKGGGGMFACCGTPAAELEEKPSGSGAAPAPAPAPSQAAVPRATAGSAQTLPAGWEAKTSNSTGETYYLNTLTGASEWDMPTAPAKPEEGEPPQSAAQSAAKLITAKSNAGFEEGEAARAKIQSELNQLEGAVDSTSAAASAAAEQAAFAKAAADKAAADAKAAGTPEEVLEAKAAQVLAASEQAKSASTTALETAEQVKKSIKALRKGLNGTTGDLATTNAQLRKENEALMELLGDKVPGTIDLSGKKTISAKSPKPSSAPPASPASARRAKTPDRGSASDYTARRAALLKSRREFEQQKAAADAAAKQKYEPKQKIALDDTEAVRALLEPVPTQSFSSWRCQISSACLPN
jgi:hypothetical protein